MSVTSAKYHKLPSSEPLDPLDCTNVAFDFSSIHTYDYPKYFSYSNQHFRSVFTYSGLEKQTDEHLSAEGM